MRHSLRSTEGWLQIDHRAGDGTRAVPGGAQLELKTVTCCHCGNVYVLNPQRARERGHCRKCNEYVCDRPECNAECRPFKKILDIAQEAAALGHPLNMSPGGIILP